MSFIDDLFKRSRSDDINDFHKKIIEDDPLYEVKFTVYSSVEFVLEFINACRLQGLKIIQPNSYPNGSFMQS